VMEECKEREQQTGVRGRGAPAWRALSLS